MHSLTTILFIKLVRLSTSSN